MNFPPRLTAAAVVLAFSQTAWPADLATKHDDFYWLGEFNKASTVMTVEQGIMPRDLGIKTAKAVEQVIEQGNKPGGERPADYLKYEPLIVAIAGPDATRMHSGRSRQDILATNRRVMLRDRYLALAEALNTAHRKIVEMARRHANVVVPAYTNGVQAQPTTYGHYLLGLAAALERDSTRLHEAYARLNLNPMGSAALGTSSFPINRERLAQLLGFDGNVENSYDATQWAQIDIGAEAAGLASTMALTVGAFVQDVHTQYHQPRPWLMLQEGKLTGTSSIMPQKRNPYALNTLRLQASQTIGDSMTALIVAHNVTPGMPDYKREQAQDAIESATNMYGKLSAMLDGLVLDPKRALEEVDDDYSTTTELADDLQRIANVPFRIGHHFASDLVTYGRANHLKPSQLPFDEAQHIYTQAARSFDIEDAKFPLTEAQFRESLSPRGMINASQGLGGPQPAEVSRMLAEADQQLKSDDAWLAAARAKLAAARQNLDKTFSALVNAS